MDRYYCTECLHDHMFTSKIGQKHIKYKEVEGVAPDFDAETPEESSEGDLEAGTDSIPGLAPQEDPGSEAITEVDPEVIELVNYLNDQIMANLKPLFDEYENRINQQGATINQLLELVNSQPQQQQGNPLAFLKELGITGQDVQAIIKQFTGGSSVDPIAQYIADELKSRRDADLKQRASTIVDAIYSGEKIYVGEEAEGDGQ